MSSSLPKAFLFSQAGTLNYPLTKKVTTVGRSNCDINLDSNVDDQHALIEYIGDENCFIIQDLNSIGGTFVNESRIQNAAVRLIEGDTIRFGYTGEQFQFSVQSQFSTIPLINLSGSQRQSQVLSTQPLQIITQTVPSRSMIGTSNVNSQTGAPAASTSFWLNPLPSASLITINNQTQNATRGEMKAPQFLRSRPVSAGPSNPQVIRRFSKATTTCTSPSHQMNVLAKASNKTSSTTSLEINQPQVDSETYRLPQEKNESKLNTLEREVKCKNKEIRELREKLAFLQNQTTAEKTSISQNSTEADQIKREKLSAVSTMNKLQKELAKKDTSINKLAGEIETLRQELRECQCKRKQIFSMANANERETANINRSEFERSNDYEDLREKAAAINMVNQMQTDLTQKDLIIKKMSTEIETLRIELRECQMHNRVIEREQSTRSELEEVMREKAVAVGLVNQMQKDLAQKEALISKISREIEIFKRDLKESEGLRARLEEKLKSERASDDKLAIKEKELVVIRSKFKASEQRVIELNDELLAIKTRAEEGQKQMQKQIQTFQEELEHSKIQFLDMQSAERIVRIDLEQIKRNYDSFRGKIVKSIFSTPGLGQPSGDISDDELLVKWKEVISDRSRLIQTCDELRSQLTSNDKANGDFETSLKAFESIIESIEMSLISSGRRTEKIEEQISMLKSLEISQNFTRLRDLIINLYSNEMCWVSEIESTLINSFSVEISSTESIVSLLGKIKIQIDSLVTERTALDTRITELEKTVEVRSVEFEQQMVARLNEVEIKIANEKDEFYKSEIEKSEAIHKNELARQYDQITEEKDKLVDKIDSLNKTVETLNIELNTKVTENNQTLALMKLDFEQTENGFKAQIEEYKSKIEEQSNQIEELSSSLNSSEATYIKELELFKEQVKQHSLTIVELEKESSLWNEKEIEYLEIIESLKKKKETIHTHIVPTVQSLKLVDNSLEVESMGRTVDLLRGECQTYKIRLAEQDEIIKVLRADLTTATAKLTDVHSELTEKQKRELEKHKQLVIEQQRELSENRTHMAKLSEILEKQTKQVESLKIELEKSQNLIDKYRKMSEENGMLSIELKTKLDDMQSQIKKFDCVKKEEGKITGELTALGAQCKGERHEQVISRQREALNELRQRVKQLESTRPQLPAQQQQMQQQIMLLKKQLAEMRASQALTDDINKQAQLARGHGDHASLMIEEKTAHYETQTALEATEDLNLTLLKTLGAVLDITELDGLRSLNGLSLEDRDRLLMNRTKSIEIICLKIKNLQEKIQRKDELLREYELDLARLRQAEFILQKKSEQLDEIQLFSRTKEEEIEYLKETLKAIKSELDREKQINQAIKENKPLPSTTQKNEKSRRESTETLHHHCPPADSKAATVRKEMDEKIKRKDYELKSLKNEIKSKADEISTLTSRLTILENCNSK